MEEEEEEEEEAGRVWWARGRGSWPRSRAHVKKGGVAAGQRCITVVAAGNGGHRDREGAPCGGGEHMTSQGNGEEQHVGGGAEREGGGHGVTDVSACSCDIPCTPGIDLCRVRVRHRLAFSSARCPP